MVRLVSGMVDELGHVGAGSMENEVAELASIEPCELLGLEFAG